MLGKILFNTNVSVQVPRKCSFAVNKTKEQSSKWRSQENKARPIFQKNEHFLPLDMRTY